MSKLIKTPITMLSADSRTITNGGAFLAVQGVQSNGVDFIPMALKNGAKVIITHTNTDTSTISDDIEVIKSETPRKFFSKLSNEFYQPQPSYFGAVTGTNGKTSIANFVQQFWQLYGHQAIALGTMGITGCGYKPTASLTTPDPADLHYSLQQAVKEKNISHACIEASSHGLDMYRLDGVHVQSAGFTNLSRDHLDYHSDMHSYFNAKSRLFSEILAPDGLAVLHKSIPEYCALKNICDKRGITTLSYGIQCDADIAITKYTRIANGFDVDINVLGEAFSTQVYLAGKFQLENILCAIGIAHGAGIPLNILIKLLPKIVGVKGRLEHIGTTPSGADIFVDYAHTPDALETVLKTMRPHATNNLCLIAGCGGDRDRGKRPLMGKVAVDFADNVYITDDNPRTESPNSIRADMMVGAVGAIEISGRENAIQTAIEKLQSGDVLIIAGKGHEQGQTIGTTVHPFDDGDVVKKVLDTL